MQVMQNMPLLPAQPRAAPSSPAPWPAGAEAQQPELNVPAQAVLMMLQPAKLAAYKQFVDQVGLDDWLHNRTGIYVHIYLPFPASANEPELFSWS